MRHNVGRVVTLPWGGKMVEGEQVPFPTFSKLLTAAAAFMVIVLAWPG